MLKRIINIVRQVAGYPVYLIIKIICKLVKLYRKYRVIKTPEGFGTMCIVAINIVAYLLISPYYGAFVLDVEWYMGLNRILQAFYASFIHANLAHISGNMLVLIPLMLMIEKKMGFKHLIGSYLATGVLGYMIAVHMMGPGYIAIGSSIALFGLLPIAIALYSSGISRLVLIVAYVAYAQEAALWWVPDGISHMGHLGGIMIGMLYMSIFVFCRKEQYK